MKTLLSPLILGQSFSAKGSGLAECLRALDSAGVCPAAPACRTIRYEHMPCSTTACMIENCRLCEGSCGGPRYSAALFVGDHCPSRAGTTYHDAQQAVSKESLGPVSVGGLVELIWFPWHKQGKQSFV